MAMKIVILEDNLDRQAACGRSSPTGSRTMSASSTTPRTIAFLADHLTDNLVVSLDNDRDMKPGPDGRMIDPGEGRQVAEFLAGHAPVCPVVIHTTNTVAAGAMIESLRGAGWKTRRVIPFDDMAWIASEWFPAVRRAVVGPVRRPRIPESHP